MKRTLLSAAVLIALAAPSYAWDARTGGSGPQAIGQDGGSATAQQQRQVQGQSQTSRSAARATSTSKGGSSNVSVNNTVGGGNGGSSGGSNRAPDFAMAPVGGGGGDCPVVGALGIGSGLAGGGGGLYSTISTHCNARKLAELLTLMGHSDIAMDVLRDEYDVVDKAMKGKETAKPVAYTHPAWCIESKGRWLRDLPECGEDPR